MTLKQRKYANALASGKAKTKSQALAMAGYADQTNPAMVEKSPEMKNAMLAAMQRYGVSDDFLTKTLKNGLRAKHIQYFTEKGIVTDKRATPDHSTRHKFLQTSLELKGYIKTNGIENLNLGVIQITKPVTVDDWNTGETETPSVKESENESSTEK